MPPASITHLLGWRRPLGRGVIVVALLTPFVAASWGARRAITGVSARVGPALAAATRSLPLPASDEDELPPLELGDPPTIALPVLDLGEASPARAGDRAPDHATAPTPWARHRASRGGSSEVSTPERRGILVRASTVERAIRMGGRPSGASVPASGARPAGVALSGVSRYGSALRDGDVLTAVGGSPTPSTSQAIALIAGPIRKGARAIGGEVWRGQQRFDVTVEIPARKPSRRAPREARHPSSAGN